VRGDVGRVGAHSPHPAHARIPCACATHKGEGKSARRTALPRRPREGGDPYAVHYRNAAAYGSRVSLRSPGTTIAEARALSPCPFNASPISSRITGSSMVAGMVHGSPPANRLDGAAQNIFPLTPPSNARRGARTASRPRNPWAPACRGRASLGNRPVRASRSESRGSRRPGRRCIPTARAAW